MLTVLTGMPPEQHLPRQEGNSNNITDACFISQSRGGLISVLMLNGPPLLQQSHSVVESFQCRGLRLRKQMLKHHLTVLCSPKFGGLSLASTAQVMSNTADG